MFITGKYKTSLNNDKNNDLTNNVAESYMSKVNK